MSWFLDSATARELGLETTGHAQRGVSSAPSPGATNLHLEPGPATPDSPAPAPDGPDTQAPQPEAPTPAPAPPQREIPVQPVPKPETPPPDPPTAPGPWASNGVN